jgi:tetratricopeptide (TPR) repeat protein
MQNRLFVVRVAFVAVLVVPLVACSAFDRLRALRVIKDAHTQYQRADYERAAELYEEALANDPNLVDAYFYLANSYDQQFRPALRGEPENDRLLDLAIDNYITSAERQTGLPLQTLSLQYLVAAYGPDKANDPASSEVVLQVLIKVDPSNPDNYVRLARLYEGSGLYEEAEQVFLEVRDMRADDAAVYMQLAAFYDRNEQFDQSIEALRARSALEPDNPQAYYTIAQHYWEKALRDFRLSDEQEEEYVMLGLTESDKALELNADYPEALTYKGLLMRMQADLTDDLVLQKTLIVEADALRERAEELVALRSGEVR